MEAIKFKEQNLVLGKPESMTDEECGKLAVFYNGEQYVSCWKPTQDDLARLNLGEPVWLGIYSQGHPPVYLTTISPFEEEPIVTTQED